MDKKCQPNVEQWSADQWMVTEVTEWRKLKSKDLSRGDINKNQGDLGHRTSGSSGSFSDWRYQLRQNHEQRALVTGESTDGLPDTQPHLVKPSTEWEVKIWKNWIRMTLYPEISSTENNERARHWEERIEWKSVYWRVRLPSPLSLDSWNTGSQNYTSR